MKTKFRLLRRSAYVVGALSLLLSLIYPLIQGGKASAAQLASRSIQLSDSGASSNGIASGPGSGTNVTYQVSFTAAAAASSLIIDFCSNDPIIGDSCTAPTGMSASSAALVGVTGQVTTAGWGITDAASQVKLHKASGSAIAAGSQVFDLTGITNPSTLTTGSTSASFYARIYTYGDTSYGSTTTPYVSPTSLGNYVDYGGIAMSVTNTITITARVQESLTFCISGAAQGSWSVNGTCSDPTAYGTPPALILGHGSPTAILDASAVDTGTVYSQLSTNATHGAVINMVNSNTPCGGLSTNGGTDGCPIPAVGATASAITAGVADFGMFEAASTDGTGGTGSLVLNPTYNDGVHTTGPNYYYGMDNTTSASSGPPATGNVDTTFGSQIATISGPCYLVNDSYVFGATASLTTPAGIYTANLSMIATGTF